MNNLHLLTGTFPERLRKSISFAWEIYAHQVANGKIQINKEASMQLHYSYILQQVMPLICFQPYQSVSISLECNQKIENKNHLIDLLVIGHEGKNSDEEHETKIGIEMKCYRTYAASGKKRGATDIFMKDVYADLERAEKYVDTSGFDNGIVLVMTDYVSFVHPTSDKSAKVWDYDISHETQIEPKQLTTPIGGKNINIKLNKHYSFNWQQRGGFYFVELEGCSQRPNA